MSKEIQKSNSGVQKSSTKKGIISTGMMAGLQASLGQVVLPRMFNQLVLFVLDGSGSMFGEGISGKSKGFEVHSSVINVLERLKRSKNKNSFDIGAIAFAEESLEFYPIQNLEKVNLNKDCFNPCEYLKNRSNTLLSHSLEKTNQIAIEYLEKNKNSNSKVIVIIVGDGAINDFESSIEIKKQIEDQDNITYSTILLETPEWKENYPEDLEVIRDEFKILASEGAFYLSTIDPEEIRKHMIKSITKLSKLI